MVLKWQQVRVEPLINMERKFEITRRRVSLSARKLGRGIVVAVAAGLVLSACQTKKATQKDFIDDVKPAEILYDQALNNMDAGSLGDASKKLDELERQHPFSEYSRRSQILKTFIYYRQRKYADAVNSGKRYVSLYPGDKDAAYAQYLIGMSYFRQMPQITRDQSVTARAYNAFNELVERYPESQYVEDAKRKMRATYDQLAGKEMFIGRYYQERREFLAAINRFRIVVEKYQTTRHVEEALARLVECYLSLGLVGEAQTAAAVLGNNFPDSQWYKDSLKQLAKAGLQPQENSGSWISRAGQGITPGSAQQQAPTAGAGDVPPPSQSARSVPGAAPQVQPVPQVQQPQAPDQIPNQVTPATPGQPATPGNAGV